MDFLRILHTVIHLKPIQLTYQLWYRLKTRLPVKTEGAVSYYGVGELSFQPYVYNQQSYHGDLTFSFLNIKHQFDKEIDWNYNAYGKLWTYNLTYFDFLNQEHLDKGEAVHLIKQFFQGYDTIQDGKEPYPTSLRIINLVKFIRTYRLQYAGLEALMAKDVYRLRKNLEYHLLANHLLENAFALFMAGHFLQNTAVLDQGRSLLLSQLKEQILGDGAHFELSPMYHQLMFYRVLDCIQLCPINDEAYPVLRSYAGKMLAWLQRVTFSNGAIPLVNDAAKKINPNSQELFRYAAQLSINQENLSLGASGYRMFRKDTYELFIDIGNLQPSYQPGHAHADTFNFILYSNKAPFIVDTGTSTYEIGKRRSIERATLSHNTVSVKGQNSSDVWSGFRVGKRAQVIVEKDNENEVAAAHNGFAANHHRSWKMLDKNIIVQDTLSTSELGIASFHFHPDVHIQSAEGEVVVTDRGTIHLENANSIKVENYNYAPEFNKLLPSKKIVVEFTERLVSTITI